MQIGDWIMFNGIRGRLTKIQENEDEVEVTIEFKAIDNEAGIGTYQINTIINPKTLFYKVIQPLELH